jgi:hypothetical protein
MAVGRCSRGVREAANPKTEAAGLPAVDAWLDKALRLITATRSRDAAQSLLDPLLETKEHRTSSRIAIGQQAAFPSPKCPPHGPKAPSGTTLGAFIFLDAKAGDAD